MRGYEKQSTGLKPYSTATNPSKVEEPLAHSSVPNLIDPMGRISSSSPLPVHMPTMLQLQRSIGNQAVQQLLQPESRVNQERVQPLRDIHTSGFLTSETPIQRQLWKAELRGRGSNRKIMLKAHGRWLDQDTVKPEGYLTVEEALESSAFQPDRTLQAGEIFDDETGEITTVAEQETTRQVGRAKTAKKKREEAKRKKDISTGEGFRSKRLQKNARKEYDKKRALEEAQEDTGLYHIGGDTDTEQFEDEGLHQATIDRIENLHVTQTDLMQDSQGKEELAWFKLNETYREDIQKAYEAALKNTDQIYHSAEDRPVYTASRLEGSNPQKRPALKEDTVHTGISGPIDDLSHSIPWAQVPSHLRHADEGGVNHPKNIPYENYVTNQVVNTAIERVAQTYLDEKKDVVKVVCRLWKDDHVDRTIHVYYIEGYSYPLVFATRNLGNKKPKRYKRGFDNEFESK
ncbi:hypothetical protein [Paenibacillus rigui]|uniref:Uncharacterized protein n=1 Tax=Paenibacillus rigui TaxID=554312 RepID=A0A229UNW6_9BACL|nr:hypothetical protein [Paenibacillus rigui]OXM85053.1 hypothetical protein CF651_17705 [Paenibacillus rigui]